MGHIIFLKPYLSFCVSIVTTYTYITDPPQAVPIKNASAQCHSANRPNSEAKERLILGWENDKSEWPLKSTGFPYQAWVGLLSLGSQWGGQGGMGGVLPARAQLCPSGSAVPIRLKHRCTWPAAILNWVVSGSSAPFLRAEVSAQSFSSRNPGLSCWGLCTRTPMRSKTRLRTKEKVRFYFITFCFYFLVTHMCIHICIWPSWKSL